MIYEDQLAAIEDASVKKGSVAGETDLSLLTVGFELSGTGHHNRCRLPLFLNEQTYLSSLIRQDMSNIRGI